MNHPVPFSPANGLIGSMAGIEFFVTSQTVLSSVEFFITDYGIPSTEYRLKIFRFSGAETPDKEIYSNPADIYSSVSGNSWNCHDLSRENIILDRGRYLAAMVWLRKPGPNGLHAQTIGFMEDSECELLSWMNWNGLPGDWKKDTGPYRGNFMIRTDFPGS